MVKSMALYQQQEILEFNQKNNINSVINEYNKIYEEILLLNKYILI